MRKQKASQSRKETKVSGAKLPFDVVRVPFRDIGKHWVKSVKYTSKFTEADFDSRWEEVRDLICAALGEKWSEGQGYGGDFVVSDDRNDAWTQCGGVYTKRICCLEYLTTILGVLDTISDGDKWAYHTAVEIWYEPDGTPTGPWVSGQIVLRRGEVLIPRHKFDYSSFFRKSKE